MVTKTSLARDAASGSTDLLGLDQQICFALYSTMLGFNKVYRKLLKGSGLTYPQYLVMLVLWERDGQTVSEIGGKLFLESPTLTPLLKRLEAAGFIDRVRSPSDERQVIVTLTRKGRELRGRAKAVPLGVAAASKCSADELTSLREQLVALRASMFDHAE